MSNIKNNSQWIKELDRYSSIKTQFFLYGNIQDTFLDPTKQNGEKKSWPLPITKFLEEYFLSKSYEIITFYDISDGFNFSSEEMKLSFERLSRGKETYIKQNNFSPEKQPYNNSPVSKLNKHYLKDPNKALDAVRLVMQNPNVLSAIIINYASFLTDSPQQLTDDEREFFLKIRKCSNETSRVGKYYNTLILLCDKLNDLPTKLYINNPLAHTMQINWPSESERKQILTVLYDGFHLEKELEENEKEKCIGKFAKLTEGLMCRELDFLRSFSKQEKICLTDSKALIECYKFGTRESKWNQITSSYFKNAQKKLQKRIKGQEEAILTVLDILKRAKMGMAGIQHSSGFNKPKGVLFFAGPTGVGKTELAKALAEFLFGDENFCVRFDMSEYGQEHSDQKLFGAPPGYVGYEQGGQLTNKISQNPFCILLFDEIEKAHKKILDKFLQVLEDGRMTDSKGQTVYFSESIIIFTSNIGSASIDFEKNKYESVKKIIKKAIDKHFKLELRRPELLNRFGDNFVIFDFIRPEIMEQIIDKILIQIKADLSKRMKVNIIISPKVLTTILEKSNQNIENGARGVGNVIEKMFVNPLARYLFDNHIENSNVEIISIEKNIQDGVELYELKIKKESK